MRTEIAIMSESDDVSTSHVMDWIHSLNGTSIRINKETDFVFNHLSIGEENHISASFSINGSNYTNTQLSSFWYRRGNIVFTTKLEEEFNLSQTRETLISNHLRSELDSLRITLFSIFESKKSLGSKSNAGLNKLTVLMLAISLKIDVPKTNVFTDKKKVNQLLNNGTPLITKAISEGLILIPESLDTNKDAYIMYAEEVNKVSMDGEANIFPSLVQEKLDKELELRIFYLDEEFFSMAIFSQLDEQTSVDFRRYNKKKPNRTTPYTLPKDVEIKLDRLMKKLDLNTGSIDMVVTKDGRYVFLEVNPVGQFGMVSYPCNYKLEKRIAQFLTKNHNSGSGYKEN